jgi:hypothetical protein
VDEATVGSNNGAPALRGVDVASLGDAEAFGVSAGSVVADTEIFAFNAGRLPAWKYHAKPLLTRTAAKARMSVLRLLAGAAWGPLRRFDLFIRSPYVRQQKVSTHTPQCLVSSIGELSDFVPW